MVAVTAYWICSRFSDWRVTGTSPGASENPPCRDGLMHVKYVELKVLKLPWWGSLERDFQRWCRPCHLTKAQIYVVHHQ
ncbi:hypothetical protein TNCV_1740681 [Trichonephila clavipes]|uniref:Uncharacterized protein n=1 Tax=Trichonephila clavipes TaxID=2585209 RepID=A0A8X6V2F0_TRICX|nr:hypothetical protein TNCV_1740681 [Trichonephila clavipes]